MRYILIFLLLCCPSIAKADILNAQELERECSKDVLMGFCLGYIEGWMDATQGSETVLQKVHYILIFDDGVTVGQVRLIFMKYIVAHPEELHKGATSALIIATMQLKLLHMQRDSDFEQVSQ
jgi:hypothetical protein